MEARRGKREMRVNEERRKDRKGEVEDAGGVTEKKQSGQESVISVMMDEKDVIRGNTYVLRVKE